MGLPTKLRRPPHFQTQLYSDILHNQQTDANGDLADTLLICDGGTIRVHAFIVQMASPFLRTVFQSQGIEYQHTREVLLPDFPVKDIHKMLSLIYKGSVTLRSEKEMIRLQDTLSFFQVSCDVSSKQEDVIPGSLKIHHLNRIPQDIYKPDSSILETDRASVTINGHNQDVDTTEGKPEVHHQNVQEIKPKVEAVEEDSMASRVKKRRGAAAAAALQTPTPENQPVVKLPRMKTRNPKGPLPPVLVREQEEGQHEASVLQQPPPISVTIPTTLLEAAPSVPKEEDVKTDPEDENWEQPNYRDKKWFLREAHRCQVCNTTFKSTSEASMCLGTHKNELRCYFCFETYSGTNALMRHFKKRHKAAPGKGDSVICPYCDQGIPYNSSSVHVITQHLNTLKDEDAEEEKGGGGGVNTLAPSQGSSSGRPPVSPGRSVTVSPVPSEPIVRGKRQSTTLVMEGVSGSRSPPGKKKRKSVLTFGKMNKMIKKTEEEDEGENNNEVEMNGSASNSSKMQNELFLRDMDFTVEKVTFQGKVQTFRLQKKRDLNENEAVELDD